MDYSIPPSYSEATNREWLPIIAPYLDTISLYSACLVSRKWHDILIPQLWSHPSIHFGTERDSAYETWKRFIDSLGNARLQIRRLTHTLYLDPIDNDFHDGPQHQWFRVVFHRLPNLSCLVVSGVHFFDHAALLALKTLPRSTSLFKAQFVAFPLRLLIAAGCINCTPKSLESAIQTFSSLVFLDLSRTMSARDGNVLAEIGSLPDLQILKLRGISLRDHDLRILVNSLNPKQDGLPAARHAYRLRSLDVRDNALTDESVKLMVSRLIHHDPVSNLGLHDGPSYEDYAAHGSSLVSLQAKQLLRGFDLDEYFIRNLSNTSVGRGILQDLDHNGLTHLYLANNLVSANGVINLLKAKNLHVLDIGALKNMTDLSRHFLEDIDSSSLTYLRVDYTLITAPARIEIQDTIGHDTQGSEQSDSNTHEASSSEKMLETHSDHANIDLPSYEQSTEAPIQAESSTKSAPDLKSQQDNKGSLDQDPLPSYTESSSSTTQNLSLVTNRSHGPPSNNTTYNSPEIQQIISQRKDFRYPSHRLRPGHIPTLETLVLTNIPPFTSSTNLVDSLKFIISNSAIEQHLSITQARLELDKIPGRRQEQSIKHRAHCLFALQTIILELSQDTKLPPSPSSPASKSRMYSSIDDPDVDTFWEAARDDFSFFDEEAVQSPLLASNTGDGESIASAASATLPLHDVVAVIARWRAEKRMLYETKDQTFEPGVWYGKIEIERDGKGRDVDCRKWFGMDGFFRSS